MIKVKDFLIFKKVIKLFQKNRLINTFKKRLNSIEIMIVLKGLKELKIIFHFKVIVFLNKIEIIYTVKILYSSKYYFLLI